MKIPGSFPRILENPAFARQLAVTLGGGRLAATFLIANGALIAATIWTILEGAGARWEAAETFGLGRVLLSVHSTVTFGLLALFLPFQAARLFDAHRQDGAFDQIVATGARPGALHFGNWAAAMAYAALILAVTLPYGAFAVSCKGAGALDVARDLAILLAYANVIVLGTMAFALISNERSAGLGSFVIFAGLGLLAFGHLPTALVSWTPVRLLLEPIAPLVHGSFSWYWRDPSVFGIPIPGPVFAAATWTFLALFALGSLALGPSHEFEPGLNNFGNAVLPGDRKRSRLRTLRLGLNRRIEMAFLYENRPRVWRSWDWALRTLGILAAAAAFWAISIGAVSSTSFLRGRTELRPFQSYVLAMGGIGLAIGILGYGECRARIGRSERVGPLRVSREVLAFLFLPALLGLFWVFTVLPMEANADRAIRAVGLSSVEDLPAQLRLSAERAEIPGRAATVAIFAANLFLLGRLLARRALHASSVRLMIVLLGMVVAISPFAFIALREEKVVSRAAARLAFVSPITALTESLDPGEYAFKPEMLGKGKGLYMRIHAVAAGILFLAIVALEARRALRARRKILPAATLALLAAFAVAGAAPAGEPDVEVIRGFRGRAFGPRDFCTVIVSRPLDAAGGGASRVEVSVETPEGKPAGPPIAAEAPPGTRTVIRMAIDASLRGGPARIVVRAGEARWEVEVPPLSIESDEKTRILAIGEAGAVPSVLLESQAWAGSAPLGLPEHPEAYCGCDLVLVGPTDLGSWTPAQSRALFDWVRSGGTVLFHGPIDARSLAAVPEWQEILAPDGAPRSEISGIPFHVHPLRGGRTVWAEREGEREIPVLQLRGIGPGTVGHLAVDPLRPATADRFGGVEAFWKRLEREAPFSLADRLPLVPSADVMPVTRGTSLLAVGGYFAAYAIALGPVMLILFRDRRRRALLWAYAPAVSLLFVLGAPLIFGILAEPSAVREASFVFYGIDGGEGVRLVRIDVASSGRQDHRLSLPLEDGSVFASVREQLASVREEQKIAEILASGRGPGPLTAGISVMPWGRKSIFAIGRERRTAGDAVRGKAVLGSDGNFTSELEGIPAGRRHEVLLFLTGRTGRLGWVPIDRIQAGDVPPDRLRAFVLWEDPDPPPAVESPDLLLEEPGGRTGFFLKEIEVEVTGN